jgi:hypothetical protein
MKRFIKFILFYFITLSSHLVLAGQQPPSGVEKVIIKRSFDQGKLDKLRNDSDFDYSAKQIERESIWTKISMLFNQYLNWIFRKLLNMNAPAISPWIFIIAVAILVIFIIIRLLDINLKDSLFTKSDSGNLEYVVEEENIHEMNFEQLIEESIKRSEYRVAIRYLYLYALKKLSDRHLIDWVPGKTNREYEVELQQNQAGSDFARLGYYFEYAWYGDFEISAESFTMAQKSFQGLNQTLGK